MDRRKYQGKNWVGEAIDQLSVVVGEGVGMCEGYWWNSYQHCLGKSFPPKICLKYSKTNKVAKLAPWAPLIAHQHWANAGPVSVETLASQCWASRVLSSGPIFGTMLANHHYQHWTTKGPTSDIIGVPAKFCPAGQYWYNVG